MKFNKLNAGIDSCLLAVAISGCDKDSSNKAAEDVKKSTEGAASAMQQGAEKAAVGMKEAGQKAVETVTEKAKEAGGEATPVIAKAQSLVSEKKYQEALTSLGSLKDIKLTESQQKIVDELKAQIQKLMSGDAAKAAGNLLGK